MILGTRGSALALAQTNLIRAVIHRAFPSLEVEVRTIKTSGDKKRSVSLTQSGTKGLFTKELEQALLLKKIDAAVHSLKDVLTELPPGLMIAAVAEREDASDILIFHPSVQDNSPKVIYTSSPRRKLQAGVLWPNCKVRDIRGNIETRLCKLSEGKTGDSLLLAAAGLKRLDYLQGDHKEGVLRFDPPLPFRKLSIEEMIPAPGQAAIGIEIRSNDIENGERFKLLNHAPTWAAVMAERAFLRGMGGGCATPMGAHGSIGFDGLRLRAIVGRDDRRIWRGEKTGERRNAEALGQTLADECRAVLGV